MIASAQKHIPGNWAAYFAENDHSLMAVNWEDGYRLTAAEAQTIRPSIQQFQLGESSEGHHLIAQAQRYAIRSGDTAYLTALRLFIKEEQRHSRDLGRFMQSQGIPLLKANWVDSVFRFLRRATNLEQCIVVLLTAEIVAMVYYKALHDATAAPMLRQICRQILRDEVQHLRFQTDTLGKLRHGRSPLVLKLTHLLQRGLFATTLLLVWAQHHGLFTAGGFTFQKFWRASWLRFRLTLV